MRHKRTGVSWRRRGSKSSGGLRGQLRRRRNLGRRSRGLYFGRLHLVGRTGLLGTRLLGAGLFGTRLLGAGRLRIGFLGFGHIAKQIHGLLVGFGIHALAHARRPARHDGVTAVPLAELLNRSDAVFVTLPLTPATTEMIGRTQFEFMQPGADLVTVSRSLVIDEDALLAALGNRKLAGAAIDSWDQGKTAAARFAGLDNVLLSPHRAGTRRGQAAHLVDIVEDLTLFARTGAIRNRVDLDAGY